MDYPNTARYNDGNASDSLLDNSVFESSNGMQLLNLLKKIRVEPKPLFIKTVKKNKPENFILNDSAFINTNNEKNVNNVISLKPSDITPPFKIPLAKNNSLRRRILVKEIDKLQQSSVANYSIFDTEAVVASTPKVPSNNISNNVNNQLTPVERVTIVPENEIILPTTTNNLVEDISSNTTINDDTSTSRTSSMHRKVSFAKTNVTNKSMVLTMVQSPKNASVDNMKSDVPISKIVNDNNWCPLIKIKKIQMDQCKNSQIDLKMERSRSQSRISQNKYDKDQINEELISNLDDNANNSNHKNIRPIFNTKKQVSNLNKKTHNSLKINEEHQSNRDPIIEVSDINEKGNIDYANQERVISNNDDNMYLSDPSINQIPQSNQKENFAKTIIPLKILENIKQLNNTIKHNEQPANINKINLSSKKKSSKQNKKIKQPKKSLVNYFTQIPAATDISKRKLFSTNFSDDFVSPLLIENNEQNVNEDNNPEAVSSKEKRKSNGKVKKQKSSKNKATAKKAASDKASKSPSINNVEEEAFTRKSSRVKKPPVAYWSFRPVSYIDENYYAFTQNAKVTKKSKQNTKKVPTTNNKLQLVSDIVEDFRELEEINDKIKKKKKIEKPKKSSKSSKLLSVIQSAPEINSHTINAIEMYDNQQLHVDEEVMNENNINSKQLNTNKVNSLDRISFSKKNGKKHHSIEDNQVANKDSGNCSASLKNNNRNNTGSPVTNNNKKHYTTTPLVKKKNTTVLRASPVINNNKSKTLLINSHNNSILHASHIVNNNETRNISPNIGNKDCYDNYLWINNMLNLDNHINVNDSTTETNKNEIMTAKIEDLLFCESNGIGFGAYSVDKACMDGYIRFAPLVKKGKACSKKYTLRFIVMSGKFNFSLEDHKHSVCSSGDYVVIPKGVQYEVENCLQTTGLLFYTKIL